MLLQKKERYPVSAPLIDFNALEQQAPSFLLTLGLHSKLGQTKSTIVQKLVLTGTLSAAPTDCFYQCPHCAKHKVAKVSWSEPANFCTSLKRKGVQKEGFRLDCSYLTVQWKDKRKRLAELGADSFGKLWAEVDKDIRAVAYSHWQKVDVSFYPYKYSVSEYFKQGRKGKAEMDIGTNEDEANEF